MGDGMEAREVVAQMLFAYAREGWEAVNPEAVLKNCAPVVQRFYLERADAILAALADAGLKVGAPPPPPRS